MTQTRILRRGAITARVAGVPIGKQRHIRKGVAMRSTEKSDFANDVQSFSSELPRWAVEPRPVPGLDGPEAAENPLRLRQAEAAQRHRDLDDAIAMLSEAGSSDELLIARLKKRKLQIKDEIARIARLLPN
jgi:hypothetical protein